MKKIALSLTAGLALSATASDLPFWGPDSSGKTNCVATASASADAIIESRAFTWMFAEGIDFSSCPVGFLLLFR